ncbi:ABC transporter ATP-binding protein [Telmatocola sphagniphila]|uniref:ABC transporter ATP-binding protein n=1 Tax=Telmatocola sphagniphila TaxID=1123043 RepID=A0A8E6B649_9BACT|nr:ABC transporter ATP-binding protein [Telmatocola sphagniphila]QVL31218.1 ABC transporter ATP-binding protein [Telmatocola sphagniphila]
MSTVSPPAATAVVSAEHLTKRFHQGDSVVEAIKDVSLKIEDGEFVALMGASGSGKSTFLHVMAGLTRPDEGTLTIADTDLSRLSDSRLTHFRRRKIGLVFQAFNLIPTLTAEENITLPLLTDGRSEQIEDRLEPLLDRLGLMARRHHRPDALSGGEQQRVAIARSLITQPALILADEPTGSLDSVNGQNICRLLRELSEEQRRTIVVVTHEPSVAVWASRIVVMKDGRILTEFRASDFQDAQSLAIHYQNVIKSAIPA